MWSSRASPTDTSAAATARMNTKTICPSGCPQREPATTNASPAAFSITSIDISVKTTLRLTSSPTSPSANKIAASSSPCPIGIIPFLLHSQMIGPHKSPQQKKGSKLHSDHIWPKQSDPEMFRLDHRNLHGRRWALRHQVRNFRNQDGRQQ